MFAVIGHPIEHSLSPLLHKISFEMLGINAHYTKVDVPPEKFEDFMKFAKVVFKGLNVTIPLKRLAYEACDEVDEIAKEVGAVNTILFKDNKILGFNTDVIGVRKAVETKIDPKGKRIAIIGAGGAARAAIVAFYKDAEVVVFNRTFEKAAKLAEEFSIKAKPLSEWKELSDFDIIINATPVGMDGKSTPFPPEVLRRGQVVMDMLYRPLYTPLLKEALRRGAETVNGLIMLVIQGVESERLWLGVVPSWEKVYLKLLASLSTIQ